MEVARPESTAGDGPGGLDAQHLSGINGIEGLVREGGCTSKRSGHLYSPILYCTILYYSSKILYCNMRIIPQKYYTTILYGLLRILPVPAASAAHGVRRADELNDRRPAVAVGVPPHFCGSLLVLFEY